MKHIIIFLLLILTSCRSADWHIRKAQFKQPDILNKFNDTIKLTDVRLDTIFYNDTFQVVQTVTKRDTVIRTKYLKPDTRRQIRFDYKKIKDSLNHVKDLKELQIDSLKRELKLANKESRRDARSTNIDTRKDAGVKKTESRQGWLIWVAISLGIILVIVVLVKFF